MNASSLNTFSINSTLLKAIFEHLPDAVYVIDPHTSNILYCNAHGYQDLKYEHHEVLNHSVLSLQKHIEGLPAWEDIANSIRESGVFTFVGTHQCKDGSELAVEVNTNVFCFEDKEYFLSIARNISKRTLHQQSELTRESKLWFALNEASDGLWEWNVKTNSVFFSPQLKRMLGYGPDEMEPILSSWEKNVHPDDKPQVIMVLNEHLSGKRETYQAEYRLRNRNGHYLWVRDRGKISERDENGDPLIVVGMAHNITDHKKLELRLQELAAYDDLTGILNRREGQKTLEKQLALANRLNHQLGFCVLDLDFFKRINDVYGHVKGDQVLLRICEIISENIRSSDYFYRWGGEEFCLILPDTDSKRLMTTAEKLRLAIEQYDWQGEQAIEPVTMSIGLACFPQAGKDAKTLFIKADAAMYQAKSQGRNCVVASHDIDVQA